MLAIIPIPAPTDNYIRILRARQNCRPANARRPAGGAAAIAGDRAAKVFLRAGEPAQFAAAEVPAARNLAHAVDAFAACARVEEQALNIELRLPLPTFAVVVALALAACATPAPEPVRSPEPPQVVGPPAPPIRRRSRSC